MIRDRREKLIDRGEREDARAIETRMVAFDWGLRDVGKGRWVKKKKKKGIIVNDVRWIWIFLNYTLCFVRVYYSRMISYHPPFS